MLRAPDIQLRRPDVQKLPARHLAARRDHVVHVLPAPRGHGLQEGPHDLRPVREHRLHAAAVAPDEGRDAPLHARTPIKQVSGSIHGVSM